jgi:transcriptional regulator with XRE-family HTH domain
MKTKLINTRKDKHFSQMSVAEYLKISPTQYQRKEKGEIKIFDEEWGKIAELLGVPVEEIKEDDIECNVNQYFSDVSGNYIGNNNHYCNIPIFLLENQQKYIEMLLKKIEKLENHLQNN